MRDLNKEQWKEATKSGELVILDVRTPAEIAEGIIPGAEVSDIFDQDGFVQMLESMNREVPAYVYCRSGGRSAQACQMMDQMGFVETYNLLGGFSNWDGAVAHK